jgi:hypothetical protein
MSYYRPSTPDSRKTPYQQGTEPSLEQIYYWLSQLARQLKQYNTREFLIENIQASSLTTQQKWLYQIAVGTITGLLIALIYGTTTGLIGASLGGISYGIILGLSPKFTQFIASRYPGNLPKLNYSVLS